MIFMDFVRCLTGSRGLEMLRAANYASMAAWAGRWHFRTGNRNC